MARQFLPLLGGALILMGVAAHAQTSTVTVGPNGVSGGTTVTTGPDGKPCKVVHAEDARNAGALSSSVTAGPGGVRSATTGGSAVTTRSADGTTSSSASSSRSANGTTMTTTSDGDCVVTVPKDKR